MNPRFENKWIMAGEINAHYMVGGQGSPLVLIHGAGAKKAEDEWASNLEPLARQHRVYLPDLVGYGKSDKPRIDYNTQVFNTFFDDFIAAVGLESASLVGHSLGGGIALDFILRHPEKVEKLVLVDTAGLNDEFGFMGKLLFPFFTAISRLKRDFVYVSLMTGGNGGEPVETYMDRLCEIKAPTLILWGEWDGYVPVGLARQAHKRIENSQLHIFKRCWHAPQKQKPEEFNRVVTDFLQQ